MHKFYINQNKFKYNFYYLDWSTSEWLEETFDIEEMSYRNGDIEIDIDPMQRVMESYKFMSTLNKTFLDYYNKANNSKFRSSVNIIILDEEKCVIKDYYDHIEFILYNLYNLNDIDSKFEVLMKKVKLLTESITELYTLETIFDKEVSKTYDKLQFILDTLKSKICYKSSTGDAHGDLHIVLDNSILYDYNESFHENLNLKQKHIVDNIIIIRDLLIDFINDYADALGSSYYNRINACPDCLSAISRKQYKIKAKNLSIRELDYHHALLDKVRCPHCNKTFTESELITMDYHMIETCQYINENFKKYNHGENVTKFSCSGHSLLDDVPYIVVKNIKFDSTKTMYQLLSENSTKLFRIEEFRSDDVAIYYNKDLIFYDLVAKYGDLDVVFKEVCENFKNLFCKVKNIYNRRIIVVE